MTEQEIKPKMRFYMLEVIKPAKPNGQYLKWECLCDCGKTINTTPNRLIRGHARSCGCKKFHRQPSKIEAGQKVALLTAIEMLPEIEGEPRKWKFKCDCGKEKDIIEISVTRGVTKSCGCMAKPKPKYGDVPSRFIPEYKIWKDMKRRCSGKSKKHRTYILRGTSVCDRWKNSFENFYNDMGPRPSDKHSIDRIDNEGHYCPENCRWATLYEQSINKSTTAFLTFNGQTLPFKEWCRIYNIPYRRLRSRLDRGWSVEETLLTPALRKKSGTTRQHRNHPVRVQDKNLELPVEELKL